MADEFLFQFHITAPQGEPWLVQLPRSPVYIGRGAGAEIVLTDPGVESSHAFINATKSICQMMDLGSMTGTFLDHERITPNTVVIVPPGATITIGPFHLTCEQIQGTPPAKLVVQGGPAVPDTSLAVLNAAAPPEAAPTLSLAAPVVNAVPVSVATGPSQTALALPDAEEVDDISLLFRKKALEKLQSPDSLNELMTATSSKDWLVLVALVVLLVGAALSAFVSVVETTVAGNGMLVASAQHPDRLEAVVYLDPADAARLTPGLLVRVSPVTVRKEEYGMIVGQVSAVQSSLASIAEMQATLGNDALAQSLVAQGKLVEVRVALGEDASTSTGYRWTSASGPASQLRRGTLAAASIVVDQEQLIALDF